MKEKRANKRKKLMLSSLAMLGVSTISLSVATYAWFSMGNKAEVTGMEFSAQAAAGIQISADAEHWKSTLNFVDGENTTNDFEGQDGASTPSVIKPVSTTTTVTSNELTFYELVDDQTSGLIIQKAVNPAADKVSADNPGAYYKFDIYVQNQSADQKELSLFLEGADAEKSSVKATETSTNKDYKVENAVRVAFINQGSSDNASTVVTAPENGEATAKIWEPNADQHDWAVNNRHETDSNDGFTNSTLMTANTGVLRYRGMSAEVKSGLDLSTMACEDKNATTLVTTHTAATNMPIVTLPANKITKLTVYVWIEGQDVDCNNAIAQGAVSVNLKFSVPEKSNPQPEPQG